VQEGPRVCQVLLEVCSQAEEDHMK
jgi:hypothetical protein